ncbi:MAG: hypothetical protein QXH10_09760 [Ignisphaera sp.]|uniref:Uncharacterized protein n=1 Tax=Ignisphaera aggregans TaxID=334771 RepID=A0A7C4JLA6_9CREN
MASEECILITFYSEPKEAFLTSIFRILEVFRCRYIEVFVSKSREAEARATVELLKNLVNGIGFEVHGLFPDPSDLNSFDGLAEKVLNVLKRLREKGRVVIATFTGSRLEVSTTVLSALRIREDIVLVYIPFFWGPWNKLFYPFTPKPLEPITILHPNSEDVKNMVKPMNSYAIDRNTAEFLLERMGISSKLRKGIAYAQHKLNLEFAPSTLLHPTDTKCREITISITVKGILKVSSRAADYCNHNEVIDMVNNLGVNLAEFFSENNYESRAINLLLKFSSILLPTIEECTFDCTNYRNTILTDFIPLINEETLVDTNIIYSSLQTLLYENKENIVIPLCAYIELLKHKAHFENPYEKLRSVIADLALEGIKAMKLNIDEKAFQQPCEVGIALTNKVAVTCDRKAYEEIFKAMKVKAVLVQLKPLKEVKFLKRENDRRIAYAYFALTQLKTLTAMKKIEKVLNEMKITIG